MERIGGGLPELPARCQSFIDPQSNEKNVRLGNKAGILIITRILHQWAISKRPPLPELSV